MRMKRGISALLALLMLLSIGTIAPVQAGPVSKEEIAYGVDNWEEDNVDNDYYAEYDCSCGEEDIIFGLDEITEEYYPEELGDKTTHIDEMDEDTFIQEFHPFPVEIQALNTVTVLTPSYDGHYSWDINADNCLPNLSWRSYSGADEYKVSIVKQKFNNSTGAWENDESFRPANNVSIQRTTTSYSLEDVIRYAKDKAELYFKVWVAAYSGGRIIAEKVIYFSIAHAPEVNTLSAKNISSSSAVLEASAGKNYGVRIDKISIRYGTSKSNLSKNVDLDFNISDKDTKSKKVTGLSSNTTYYYQAYVSNTYGTTYGTIKSFRTLDHVSDPLDWSIFDNGKKPSDYTDSDWKKGPPTDTEWRKIRDTSDLFNSVSKDSLRAMVQTDDDLNYILNSIGYHICTVGDDPVNAPYRVASNLLSKYTSVDGNVVFVFDGISKNLIGKKDTDYTYGGYKVDSTHSSHLSAVTVVVRANSAGKPQIVFANENTGTFADYVRCQYWDTSGYYYPPLSTKDGIYNLTFKNHKSYAAYNISNPAGLRCSSAIDETVRGKRLISYVASDKNEGSNSIDFHFTIYGAKSPKGFLSYPGPPWAGAYKYQDGYSTGCFTLGGSTSEYNNFIEKMTGLKDAYPNKKIDNKTNVTPSIVYDSTKMKYSMNTCVGIMVLDRYKYFDTIAVMFGDDEVDMSDNMNNGGKYEADGEKRLGTDIASYLTEASKGWQEKINKILNNSQSWIPVFLSGTITSFLDASNVTLRLLNSSGAEVHSSTWYQNYKILVEPGDYILEVSKKNHTKRYYPVSVRQEDVTLNVKIHPIGDVTGNGDIGLVDLLRIKLSSLGMFTLKDYLFTCGDVNSDGEITAIDFLRAKLHYQGKINIYK